MNKIIVKDVENYDKKFYNEPVLYKNFDMLVVKYKTDTFEYEPFRTDLEKDLLLILNNEFFKIKIVNENVIIFTFKNNDVLFNFNYILEVIKKFNTYNFFIKYNNLSSLENLFKVCIKNEIKKIVDPDYGHLLMIKKIKK